MTRILPTTDQDIDAMVRTLYGEARGEPLEGQQAVAWVIRNRVEWPSAPHWWGRTVTAACHCPKQFSCWNSNDPNLIKVMQLPAGSPEYQQLEHVARAVCGGEIDDLSIGASHYEVTGTHASWGLSHEPVTTIGRHVFYRIGPG